MKSALVRSEVRTKSAQNVPATVEQACVRMTMRQAAIPERERSTIRRGYAFPWSCSADSRAVLAHVALFRKLLLTLHRYRQKQTTPAARNEDASLTNPLPTKGPARTAARENRSARAPAMRA